MSFGSFFSDAWDSFSGALRDAGSDLDDSILQPTFHAIGDAMTDTGKAFSDGGEFLVNTLWRPILGSDPIDADNLDDWDPDTLAALMSVVPGPWQPFAAAYSMGSGAYDMSQNGLNWRNAMQVAPGAVGAFKGFGTASAAGTSKLGGALKGSVGMAPTPTSSPNPYSMSDKVASTNLNPYQSTAQGIQSGGSFGGDIASMAAPTANTGAGFSQLSESAQAAVDQQYSAPANTDTQSFPYNASEAGSPPSAMDQFVDGATSSAKDMAGDYIGEQVVNRLMPTEGQPISGGATEAFAPPSVATDIRQSFDPLYGDEQVKESVYNLGQNAQSRKKEAFDMFRRINPGSSIEGNSAFTQSLAAIDESSDVAQSELLQGMDTANKEQYEQDTYDELMNINGFNSDTMDFYIDLAGKSDEEIGQYITDDVGKFKEVFASINRFRTPVEDAETTV